MSCALIIASIFPPGSTSAGVRCGKLARSAARAGLHVRFIHAGDAPRTYEWRDGVRCTAFDAPIAARVFRRQAGLATPESAPGRGVLRRPVTSFVKRVLRAALQPDEYVLEARRFTAAIVAAASAVRAAGMQPIILACCPPWSTSIPARWAAERVNAPLVLDLQDLWLENPVARWTGFGRAVARRLERRAFAAATGFVFINERIAQRYIAAHEESRHRPSVVAHIGAERPPDAPMVVAAGEPFELLHIGSIYGDRNLSGLLDACVALRSDGRDIYLTWYGAILGNHPLRARVDEYRRAGALRMHGPIPHDVARQRMREASVLVTVPSPVYEEELTGKLFDYMDARRPVLALAPRASYIGEVVQGGGIGSVMPPDDGAGLRELLSELIGSGRVYNPIPAALAAFSLDTIGSRIRRLTDDICP